jgi:ATPase subunit of ABC transporter with duplicated ATPase domains
VIAARFPELRGGKMTGNNVSIRNVSFAYDSPGSAVIEKLSIVLYPGWTGVVGINGAGKTTLLKLSTGLLIPQEGSISIPGEAVYCSQRTDNPPEMFEDFLCALDGGAGRLKGLLGIEADWFIRWNTLSHGERKRVQIGVALWRDPPLLAIDEPTNHLDSDARNMVAKALESFRGIGLLVSHDLDLLDSLCANCFFLNSPGAVLRPGGYTMGREQEEQEADFARKEYYQAKEERKRIDRERLKRRTIADSAHKRISKRGLAPKDSDGRAKRDLAIISGKDGVAGKLLRQMDGRYKRAIEKEKNISLPAARKTGIRMPTRRSRRDTLFSFSPFHLPLGDTRRLNIPEMVMYPEDRIALTGPNGSGKSTFLEYLVENLNLPKDRVVYIPQEVDADAAERLIQEIRELSRGERGELMSIFSRLGSDPVRLLESGLPSPGETRKVMLVLGIIRIPELIIMDEPTNHLDLSSIECLEAALEETDCGLLLVSHDQQFLDKLSSITWTIERNGKINELLTLT